MQKRSFFIFNVCILNVQLDFSSTSSIQYFVFVFFVIMIFVWFPSRFGSVFYITRLMKIYYDKKRIKRLFITKMISSLSYYLIRSIKRFWHNLFPTVLYYPGYICIIVTNALIIADKAHLF